GRDSESWKISSLGSRRRLPPSSCPRSRLTTRITDAGAADAQRPAKFPAGWPPQPALTARDRVLLVPSPRRGPAPAPAERLGSREKNAGGIALRPPVRRYRMKGGLGNRSVRTNPGGGP